MRVICSSPHVVASRLPCGSRPSDDPEGRCESAALQAAREVSVRLIDTTRHHVGVCRSDSDFIDGRGGANGDDGHRRDSAKIEIRLYGIAARFRTTRRRINIQRNHVRSGIELELHHQHRGAADDCCNARTDLVRAARVLDYIFTFHAGTRFADIEWIQSKTVKREPTGFIQRLYEEADVTRRTSRSDG